LTINDNTIFVGSDSLYSILRRYFIYVLGKELIHFDNIFTLDNLSEIIIESELNIENEYYSIYPIWNKYSAMMYEDWKIVVVDSSGSRKNGLTNNHVQSINLLGPDWSDCLINILRNYHQKPYTAQTLDGSLELVLRSLFSGHGDKGLLADLGHILFYFKNATIYGTGNEAGKLFNTGLQRWKCFLEKVYLCMKYVRYSPFSPIMNRTLIKIQELEPIFDILQIENLSKIIDEYELIINLEDIGDIFEQVSSQINPVSIR